MFCAWSMYSGGMLHTVRKLRPLWFQNWQEHWKISFGYRVRAFWTPKTNKTSDFLLFYTKIAGEMNSQNGPKYFSRMLPKTPAFQRAHERWKRTLGWRAREKNVKSSIFFKKSRSYVTPESPGYAYQAKAFYRSIADIVSYRMKKTDRKYLFASLS